MVKHTTNSNNSSWYALAVARIMLGLIFIWAFFDKLLGLGMATPAAKAWLEGGSPTTGFLTGASKAGGPFADVFHALIGQPWVDWLFMLGLLGIGAALILGIGMRIASITGALLMVMMWAASLPLDNHPFLDDHLVYAAVLIALPGIEQRLSIEKYWRSLPIVKKYAWLR